MSPKESRRHRDRDSAAGPSASQLCSPRAWWRAPCSRAQREPGPPGLWGVSHKGGTPRRGQRAGCAQPPRYRTVDTVGTTRDTPLCHAHPQHHTQGQLPAELGHEGAQGPAQQCAGKVGRDRAPCLGYLWLSPSPTGMARGPRAGRATPGEAVQAGPPYLSLPPWEAESHSPTPSLPIPHPRAIPVPPNLRSSPRTQQRDPHTPCSALLGQERCLRTLCHPASSTGDSLATTPRASTFPGRCCRGRDAGAVILRGIIRRDEARPGQAALSRLSSRSSSPSRQGPGGGEAVNAALGSGSKEGAQAKTPGAPWGRRAATAWPLALLQPGRVI